MYTQEELETTLHTLSGMCEGAAAAGDYRMERCFELNCRGIERMLKRHYPNSQYISAASSRSEPQGAH